MAVGPTAVAAALAIAAIVLASVKGLQRARLPGVLALTLSLVVIGPPLYLWRMVGQVPRRSAWTFPPARRSSARNARRA